VNFRKSKERRRDRAGLNERCVAFHVLSFPICRSTCQKRQNW